MTDREKVIKGLECCKPAWFTVANCADEHCPYDCYGHNEVNGCVDHLIDDALELLKKQNPASPTWEQGEAYCGKCGMRLPRKRADREINYCGYCGRPVKWQ